MPGAEAECIPFKFNAADVDVDVGVKPDEAVPNAERRSVADGRRELAFELPPPKPRRLTIDDVRDGRSGSPRIGAD